jgi:fatty acid desaturase
MNATRFARRTDIPPALLQPARLPMLLRAACIDWVVIIACWTAMYLGPHALWPLWMLLVAGRLHALGVVLHDACHMKRASPTASSRLLELLAGYPITSTLAAMRYHHLRHHRHSGMALDPYFKPGASHRFWPAMLGRLRGPVMVLAWFVRGFFGCAALAWPGLRNAYGRIFFGERSDLDLTRHAEIARCLRAEPSQALFFVALVPVALLLPQAFLVGCLLPLMLAGLFNANRVVAEHLHVRTTDRDPSTIVATTRTHDWGLAGRLFLFPRNIGFHVAHHLHPTVAMEHLPALDAWYRANEPGYRAPASIESILMQRPAAGTTEDGAAS